MVPFLLATGLCDCILLFFMGRIGLLSGLWVVVFAAMFNAWGNFAPFYEIAAGAMLDGICRALVFLPMLCFTFYFYIWYISKGFLQALADHLTHREPRWDKTERFATDDQFPQKEGT
jgi:hypothetical protein